MGAAASLAERHVEADISLADAKALVPPGAWDDRWDGQFGAAAGRVDRRVGLALLARRLEHLGGARDWAAAPSPAALRDAKLRDIEAAAARSMGEAVDGLAGARPPAAKPAASGGDNLFFECLLAKVERDRDAARAELAAERRRSAKADGRFGGGVRRAAAAAVSRQRDRAWDHKAGPPPSAAAPTPRSARRARVEARRGARRAVQPATPRRSPSRRRRSSTSRRSSPRRRGPSATARRSARRRRARGASAPRRELGDAAGADDRRAADARAAAARAAAAPAVDVAALWTRAAAARRRARDADAAGQRRPPARAPRALPPSAPAWERTFEARLARLPVDDRKYGWYALDKDDAAGKPVEYRGYVYTSGTLAAGCPGMDLGRVVCHSSYCDTEEVWRIANDWPFATEICTWDGKGTYDGPAQEEDGYTGADCWKAAPDPANEDDEGRTEQNKENRATDWECDMLHDQHDVFYKVLIGLFYICPLTAFVFSCISQAHPEGPDKFWGQPAKVAPANM
ncbi:tudor domain-containing protein [Aureococcus anophagefferens]|nr:tudor domain-containing protein [Aureococcus anophagefferens]